MPYLQIQTTPHFYDLTPAIPGAATLVFIHGWVLSHRYWTPITNTLASHYRCLTYDLRGFGASNHIPPSVDSGNVDSGNGVTPDYGLSAYARDLETLLQKLNLGPVWLVGHSLGGSIALWAAHLWPDRVQGVICVNAGGGIYLPEEFQRFRRAGTQIVRWRSSWLSRIPLLDLGFARMMVAQPLSRQWGRQRLLDLLAAHPEAALGALLASTTEAEVHRLPQVVASLRQPTYFVAGGADPVMEERYVRHLASFHTLFHQEAGNVSVLPHCGHMAMLEQPSALAQQIRQYVEAVARMDTSAKPIDSHRATTAILQKPMNGV